MPVAATLPAMIAAGVRRIVVRRASVLVTVLAVLGACAPASSPSGAVASAGVTCPPRFASADAAQSATPLPDGEPVGRGVLLYAPASDAVAWLITESGAVYSVPTLLDRPGLAPVPTLTSPLTYDRPPSPPPVDPMSGLRLSPDGRWLERPGPGYLAIRDLMGTRQLTLASSDMGAWSDDGDWTAITDIRKTTLSLYDLDTGTTIPVRLDEAHALWHLNAIFGPHEVLLQRFDPRGDENPTPGKQYATVDPSDGRVLHQYTVDFDSPGAEGHIVAWTTDSRLAPADGPREVIIGSLDSGNITARYPLPSDDPRVDWFAVRTAGDHVVLIRTPRLGDTTAPKDPVRFFNFDPTTGARQSTCVLPPQTHFVLRGFRS